MRLLWVIIASPTTNVPKSTPKEDCTNQLDDDGDGRVDCLDSDCAAHASYQIPPENCTNGIDDDGDGADFYLDDILLQ
ncbi:hypothetical protein KKD52_04445 [Myxococcota bacterium]|nr:hypothetical protein [Myxococcota bacterium]MBU1413308.1 hypothetical protein [Myxococcota bacterium]MBU1509593.1 hypothetical protein [Myxococcota bacterium]